MRKIEVEIKRLFDVPDTKADLATCNQYEACWNTDLEVCQERKNCHECAFWFTNKEAFAEVKRLVIEARKS